MLYVILLSYCDLLIQSVFCRLYALGISLLSFVMLFHHILYYLGYRMGIQQRVQVTAAIHCKPSLIRGQTDLEQ